MWKRYILVNGLFLSVMYFALIQGAVWATNVLLFSVWAFLGLSVFTAMAYLFIVHELKRNGLREFSYKSQTNILTTKGNLINFKFDYLYDIFVVFAFVYFGWFVCAVVYMVTSIISLFNKELVKESADLITSLQSEKTDVPNVDDNLDDFMSRWR